MSEPTAAPAKAPGGKKENVFTHHLGPLPMWGWVGIAAAVLVAWRLYSSKKNGTSKPTNSGTAGNGSAGLAGGASPYDIPQFVNQTYTSVTAPGGPTYTHPDHHRDHDHDGPPDRDRGHDADDHFHGPPGPPRPGDHMDHDHDDWDQGRDQDRGRDRDRNNRGRGGGFGGGGGRQDGGRDGQHWTGQWHHRNSPSARMHGDHAGRGGGSGRYGRGR